MKWADELELNHFEGVKRLIFLIAGESSLDFLSRKHDVKGDVSLYPRCNAMFDRNVAKAFEKRKLGQQIAEKEAEKEQLQWKMDEKKKMFDFEPFDPKCQSQNWTGQTANEDRGHGR